MQSHHFMTNRWGNNGNSERFIFLGSRITADGDCSHEIKRRLLLERKAMTNVDSILQSRDITLPTKVCLVKAMVFPVVMCGCESWPVKKAEHRRIDAFEFWCCAWSQCEESRPWQGHEEGSWHTQGYDQTSGVPLEFPEHVPQQKTKIKICRLLYSAFPLFWYQLRALVFCIWKGCFS